MPRRLLPRIPIIVLFVLFIQLAISPSSTQKIATQKHPENNINNNKNNNEYGQNYIDANSHNVKHQEKQGTNNPIHKRSLQQQQQQQQSNTNNNIINNNNNDYNYQTCPNTNENYNINQVLNYLDKHKTSLEERIFQTSASKNTNATKPTKEFLYDDFREALEWISKEGVVIDSNNNGNDNNNKYQFYMGPNNCNKNGWHIGLANVAAFLSQSMSTVMILDTCDELNWDIVDAPSTVDLTASGGSNAEGNRGVYPISNACGMQGYDYQEDSLFTCGGSGSEDGDGNANNGDTKFACPVVSSMKVTAVSSNPFKRTPPPLQCFPRSVDMPYTGYFNPGGKSNSVTDGKGVVPSRSGRTDVEGCCWWGRGALHTKGTCNLGKLNYYLGAATGAAATDKRSNNRYSDIDFCRNPESICTDSRTMKLRWEVALFEWVERIQPYDDGEWNYIEQLHSMMEGDLFSDLKFEQTHFIDSVGGVLSQGCPHPPCDKNNQQRLHLARERKANFRVSLEALGLPIKGEAFLQMEKHLTSIKHTFENVVLRSKNPTDGKMYQSYRYHFADFLESLRLMSDIGFEGNQFFIGQNPDDDEDVDINAGMLNVALFLTYAVVMSIEDDACDEHNTQMVSGRFPVSNACGQYGVSNQDIRCPAVDKEKECPLDLNQSFSAVTRALHDRAPQPFKCAPKSQYPVTGYWDDKRIEEDHKTAFSNELGRTDVEGCCWWGRGVLRRVSRGRCIFGQMNWYIGKRSAMDGRPSLYPTVDFCEFPEAICASEFSNELRWVSGLFQWIIDVQSYNRKGFNYMEKVRAISTDISNGSALNPSFVKSVDCILKTGSSDCDQAEDHTDTLDSILSAIADFKLPTLSPTTTTKPSVTPTDHPTVTPSASPSTTPTHTVAPTGSPIIFTYPSREFIDAIIKDLKTNQFAIEEKILMPKNSAETPLYNFDGLIETIKVMAEGTVTGKYFYVGHGKPTNRVLKKRGMVNIALFLAHTKTVAVHANICDEPNTDEIDNKLPLSNACGQYGNSYQDQRCPDASESFMECPPDPNMQSSAVFKGEYSDDSVPPFFCGSRQYFPFTGYYDTETKEVINDDPTKNRAGRDDVSSCCWWGRGSAQATGVCMYGKLNYYIGARAAAEGRRSLYPEIDFCRNPSQICSGPYALTLMWITGIFVWIEQIQQDYVYSELLDDFVSNGLPSDDLRLVDMVSDVLDGGRRKEVRQANFLSALEAVGITSTAQLEK